MSESTRAPGSWSALVAIGVGAFALVTTEFLPVGLLPQIARDMRITEGHAGLMVTLSGLLAALAAPLTISLAKNFDRRHVLSLLLAMLALSNLTVAVAPGFAVILIGRILLGITVGGFWAVAGSLGPRLRPGPQAGLATSIILSGVSLGTVAGVPAGALIGALLGWRLAFGASAGITLLVLVALMFLLPRLEPTGTSGLKGMAELLKLRKAQIGLVATVLAFVGQFSAYTYIAPFLLQVTLIDPVTLSAILLGFGIAGFAGNLLGGWAVGHGVRRTLIATAVLLGVSVLMLALVGAQPLWAVPLVLVWGVGFGMLPIVMQSWMFSAAPHQLESVQAMFVSVAQASIGSGALIGGLMTDRFGVNSVLWLGAAAAFGTATLVAVFQSRES
ncbi:MAG TPA: MFS transporter [Steroidobacteraceae bacterium]|nr:MFS transporter [Steroidobacteraceae bacterium]